MDSINDTCKFSQETKYHHHVSDKHQNKQFNHNMFPDWIEP